MKKLLEKYIGMKVEIHIDFITVIEGIMVSVSDTAVEIQNKKSIALINIDKIKRVGIKKSQ